MYESGMMNQISHRLTRLVETSEYYNFECPFCGEGDSAGKKRRGYILKRNDFSFYCHNCFESMKFSSFLFKLDKELYYQFKEESAENRFNDTTKNFGRSAKPKPVEVRQLDSSDFEELNPKILKSMSVLDGGDDAFHYLTLRRVPEETISRLRLIGGDTIVFPFWTKNYGTIYGFQSRQIFDKRFHIELQKPDYPKIWNLFNVDLDKPVYIFEGFFDSIVIDNSIALNGADISPVHLKQIKRPVFVLDNDRTGLLKAKKYLSQGHEIFVYPDNFEYKDFNEFYIKSGMSRAQIENFIVKNVKEPDLAYLSLISQTFR